jgi:hypothetical protein
MCGPLQFQGGPVLTVPWIMGIFWGKTWNTSNAGARDKLTSFLSDLPIAGGFNHVLSQYGMFPIPAFAGTQTASIPMFTGTLTDADVQANIAWMMNADLIQKPPSGQLLLVIFLDDTVQIDDPNSMFRVCTATNANQTGYHGTVSWPPAIIDAAYAVVGSLSDACLASLDGFTPSMLLGKAPTDRQTIIASHEIAEAVTDPKFGQPNGNAWVFPALSDGATTEEIADFCEYRSDAAVQIQAGSDTWWVQQIYDLQLDKATQGAMPCSANEPNALPTPSCFGPTPFPLGCSTPGP